MFVGFTTYAIVRHRLLDIRLVITRSIIYFFLIAFITLTFASVTFLAGQLFTEEGGNPILTTIIISIIVVFGLDPLKRWIGRLTDAIFFKGAIDYDAAARNLSDVINREIELQKLIDTFDDKLVEALKAKRGHILLLEPQTDSFVTSANIDRTVIVQNTLLIRSLLKERETYVFEELERKQTDERNETLRKRYEQLYATMESVNASTVTPLIVEQRIIGLILMEGKLSGGVYTTDDISLLDLVASQLATAIEKAKLFEEVRTFSEKLKLEVDNATKDLAEANEQLRSRNLYLSALQSMTSLITQSLDFKKVTQSIVDGIAKELGYLGGILVLLDSKTNHTYAAAITQTPLTRRAFKILPQNPMKYYGDFTQEKTLGDKAIKTGAIQISESFADFFHPPLPRTLCIGIQNVLRARTIVGVPIAVEGERIGVIVFVLKKVRQDVSHDEMTMMKSLSDQMGIVTRNARLYEQIQQANADLASANVRLRRLDEAKNDFISIASHQLRTPLSGIVGYLSMLTGGDFGKLRPEVRRIMDQLLDASRRLVRLVNIFLNISRIESGRLTIDRRETLMENIIETEINELSTLAKEKGIRLIFKRPKRELPAVMIDGDKMRDVVQNLIDNAIKYTDKGKVTVTVERDGDALAVRITDTGIGIDPHETQHLFNKFVRGEGIARIQPDGSGLGLYIAKRIVEGHGGKIWVESEGVGRGTTFAFMIPIHPASIDTKGAKV